MTYTSFYYYSSDDHVEFDNEGNYLQLSAGQEAALSGTQEFLVQRILAGESHFVFKFLAKGVGGPVGGEVFSQTVDYTLELIDDNQNARITIGEGVDAITNVVATALLTKALIAGTTALVGSQVIAFVATAAVTSLAVSFAVDLRNEAVEALVNLTIDNDVDVKFFDANGNSTEGVYFFEGLSPVTPKFAVDYLISHSETDLSGGHIGFYVNGFEVGSQYNIYDASPLTRVAELVGKSFDDFINTASSGNSNIDQYAVNANGLRYVYGEDGEIMRFFIPIQADGQESIVIVNNIYKGTASGELELAIGEGDSLFSDDVQLIIPESSVVISINGDDNDRNLIISDANGHVIHGGANADTILGNTGNDTLIGGSGSDHLIGGADVDTYVISSSDVGDDTIDDTTGVLVIDGATVAGATAVLDDEVDGLYHWGSRTLMREGGDIRLTLDGDSSVLLKNFASGDYGITLSNGNDSVTGAGDTLFGSDDTYATVYGNSGQDYITEGYVSELGAYDNITYSRIQDVRISPLGTPVNTVRAVDVEGTNANNSITAPEASRGSITIRTYAGSDTITSHRDYGASQTVYAGDDVDSITTYGGLGAAYGEGGNDLFTLNTLGNAAPQLAVYGGAGRDSFFGVGATSIAGGTGRDSISSRFSINAKLIAANDNRADGGNGVGNDMRLAA